MPDSPLEPAPAPIDPAHLAPVDVDGVRAVATGTVVWTVLLVVCLLMRDSLAENGRGWWTGVCFAGAVLGAIGLVFVRWRRDRIAASGAD